MESQETDIRQARHDLRGRLNGLKLCISAFELLHSEKEVLEFLDLVEQAADRTAQGMDALDAAVDRSMGILP